MDRAYGENDQDSGTEIFVSILTSVQVILAILRNYQSSERILFAVVYQSSLFRYSGHLGCGDELYVWQLK